MTKKILSVVIAAILCFSMVACSVDEVLTDLDLAVQMTATLIPALGNISTSDAAEVAKLTTIAEEGLAVVRMDYEAYETSGATSDLARVQAVADALRSNLSQNLQAAHIGNEETVRRVTAWVGLVALTLDAITRLSQQAVVLPAHCYAGSKFETCMSFASSVAGMYVPKAATLKKDWDKKVCKGNKACEVKIRKSKKK